MFSISENKHWEQLQEHPRPPPTNRYISPPSLTYFIFTTDVSQEPLTTTMNIKLRKKKHEVIVCSFRKTKMISILPGLPSHLTVKVPLKVAINSWYFIRLIKFYQIREMKREQNRPYLSILVSV